MVVVIDLSIGTSPSSITVQILIGGKDGGTYYVSTQIIRSCTYLNNPTDYCLRPTIFDQLSKIDEPTNRGEDSSYHRPPDMYPICFKETEIWVRRLRKLGNKMTDRYSTTVK